MEKVIDADVCKYNAIDLGLPSGLKWVDRNVGAERPEDFGDYFMCGSTEPDTDNVCDWAHAPFNNGSEEFDEEYFSEHKSEWATDEGVLKPEYDAAHMIMGGAWMVPTSAEMLELLEGTTQTVETLGGVEGMRFTAPNGNSIFIPFAGIRHGSNVSLVGSLGGAWSSSLRAGYADYSHYLYFDGYGLAGVGNLNRCLGFAVRGVHE